MSNRHTDRLADHETSTAIGRIFALHACDAVMSYDVFLMDSTENVYAATANAPNHATYA